MKRVLISRGGIACMLSSIILLLTAYACNVNPEISQGDATATATATAAPAPVLQVATSAPLNFSLEFSREGSLSAGGISIQWGPDTALIPLEYRDGAYAGSYAGEFTALVTGTCSGTYTYPVSIEVTATEDGSGSLDFTVTATMSMAGVLSCAPGPVGNAPVTFTRTFKLPAEEGASWVYDVPMQSYGQITDTYTLKAR